MSPGLIFVFPVMLVDVIFPCCFSRFFVLPCVYVVFLASRLYTKKAQQKYAVHASFTFLLTEICYKLFAVTA